MGELVNMLVGAPSIDEQADILHYLVLCYGPKAKLHVSQVRVVYATILLCLFVCIGPKDI